MSAFLVYILKVALLTAVFVLLYHLLLRRETFHRTARIVLVSSLIISYILPFCVITIHRPAVVENPEVAAIQAPAAVPATPTRHTAQPDIQPGERQIRQEQNQIKESAGTQVLLQQEVQQAVVSPDSNQTMPIPVRRHTDWVSVLMFFYAIGVVCLLAFRLLSAFKVNGIIRRSRIVKKKDGCRVVLSSENIRPFSWMSYIVLPENYSDLSCATAVIRHEYSHISHHHSIELLLFDIMSAFQWFNPAVWLLRHDLCCVQEFQADASVLESGYGKLEYERSLLSIATGGISIPLVNGLGESYLRARIRMMNRNISRKGNLIKLIYLPLVMVVALVLISNTVYDKVETDNTEVESDQEEAVTIFRFGEEVKKEFIDSFQDDYDDSALETEEVFKTRIGDASGGITVTLFNYTDKDWNNDPGDFRIMDIDVAGRHYRFRNSDWVWEEMFDNGYFHCCKVSDSRYLLFLKGFDYGCCPGTLTVFAIDETGVYPVMNKEYHLREFNREPFSMTVADWYDEYVSDDVTINSTTYTLFIEDGALKKRWVQLDPNKHEYVDLGLSVNWATCNIGADKPEEYGDYFAWGEMAPHYKSGYAQEEPQEHWNSYMSDGYWWSTYMWSKDTHSSLTKYCNAGDLGNNGFTDKMTELVPADDAARMLWGSKWRMPTKSEMEELFNKCTWTWTKENGVYGYRVTSNVSGYTDRSIFLPAAGIRGGKSLNGIDSDGMYWSSSLDTDNSLMAWSIFFVNGNLEGIDDDVSITPFSRHNGQSIRPVLPTERSHKVVYESNNEPIAYGTEVESKVLVADESPESVEPEASQMVTARFDGSLPESQVALLPYRENNVMPQSLPEIILDSLKIQYPELNTLESIFDDDGIKTNNKAYKGYLNFIRVSNSVYEFWIAGIEEKGGKTVTIEMGSIDDAITILENLITSYKQGNTIEIGGYSFTGVKGKAYSIPRNDGSDSGPYLVSVKNLKHDLSVLEKRKNWKEVGFDEIAFFSMENKPDHYEVLFPGWPRLFESLHINTWDGVDGGEEWARTELEKQIRERGGEGHVPGNSELAVSKFNGVILLPLHKSDYMTLSGAYKEYIQYYIPIIYDPEKYQAPLTDYQRSLKRNVFRRKK